jgi:hypothetical protein
MFIFRGQAGADRSLRLLSSLTVDAVDTQRRN